MVVQEIFQELVQHKVSLVVLHLKMEKLLVEVVVVLLKLELIHQVLKVLLLVEEEVQEHLIILQDQLYHMLEVVEVE